MQNQNSFNITSALDEIFMFDLKSTVIVYIGVSLSKHYGLNCIPESVCIILFINLTEQPRLNVRVNGIKVHP